MLNQKELNEEGEREKERVSEPKKKLDEKRKQLDAQWKQLHEHEIRFEQQWKQMEDQRKKLVKTGEQFPGQFTELGDKQKKMEIERIQLDEKKNQLDEAGKQLAEDEKRLLEVQKKWDEEQERLRALEKRLARGKQADEQLKQEAAKRIEGKIVSLAKNLCKKINPKLGGVNWTLNVQQPLSREELQKIMFIGADVYHPPEAKSVDPPHIRFAPSVAAVCIFCCSFQVTKLILEMKLKNIAKVRNK